jgi:hypothetical protein
MGSFSIKAGWLYLATLSSRNGRRLYKGITGMKFLMEKINDDGGVNGLYAWENHFLAPSFC